MKQKRQVRKNRPTSEGNAQRKSSEIQAHFPLPASATRRRLAAAAFDEERGLILKEKVAFIEQHGSPAQRLSLSTVIAALAALVKGRKAAGAKRSSTEEELFFIAEIIRFARTLETTDANIVLTVAARSLSNVSAQRALLKAVVLRAGAKRDAMLDFIQIGDFSGVTK